MRRAVGPRAAPPAGHRAAGLRGAAIGWRMLFHSAAAADGRPAPLPAAPGSGQSTSTLQRRSPPRAISATEASIADIPLNANHHQASRSPKRQSATQGMLVINAAPHHPSRNNISCPRQRGHRRRLSQQQPAGGRLPRMHKACAQYRRPIPAWRTAPTAGPPPARPAANRSSRRWRETAIDIPARHQGEVSRCATRCESRLSPTRAKKRQRQTAACEGQIHHPAAGDRHQPRKRRTSAPFSTSMIASVPGGPGRWRTAADHRQRTAQQVNIPPKNAI